MGATTLTDRRPATWLSRHAVRIALIAIAVVLLAVAFVVGRTTADTSPAVPAPRVTTPVAPRPAHVPDANSVPCRVGGRC
jgi:hypothetical protein